MAKKSVKADPPEDIPAWFMTYSDVITLLMTFFILLLTFSTTEPERFEKVTSQLFGNSGSTGVAGHPHEKLDRDSWSQRIRPRAARIALDGSEMPPIMSNPATASVGRGLVGVTEEEAKKDVMKTYSFELPLADLVDSNTNLTRRGVQVASTLSPQLRSLPVHCAIEVGTLAQADRASALAHHLFHVEKARPGQIGVGISTEVDTGKVRFVIERYQP